MATLLKLAHEKATAAAVEAANEVLAKRGDGYPCGFAWVTYYPVNKGNTRDGREERRLIESIGFRKDYTGKAYQLWNPSKNFAQNVDVKEAGAYAYAKVLEAEAGIRVSVGSRLD
jgi:hypothetical protein